MNIIYKICSKLREKGCMGFLKTVNTHLVGAINKKLYRVFQYQRINEKLLVFESEGDLTDNSYALYDYMNKKGYLKKYQTVWLVNDISSALGYAKREGGFPNTTFVKKFPEHIDLRWSKSLATCKYFFYDHSNVMHDLKKRKQQTVVYLTHGFAGYKAGKGGTEREEFTYPDYVMVTCKLSAELYPSFANFGKAKFLTMGMPRLDYFGDDNSTIRNKIESEYRLSRYKKVFLWMPTFRESNHKEISEEYLRTETHLPIIETEIILDKFNLFLQERSLLMVLKIHPLQKNLPVFQKKYSNIIFLRDEQLHEINVQLYQFIALTDALITDYSSISADYMLLNRPMIFTLDDYEEYKESRGEFLPGNAIDYWTGAHVYNLKEFCSAIEEIEKGKDPYKKEREKLISIFYEGTKRDSAKKILNFFRMI